MFVEVIDIFRSDGVVRFAELCTLTNRVCLDFFSGVGGFSEAFRDRGWKVIRIDYDKKFSHIPDTTIADIMKISISDIRKLGGLKPDILLMSPPCQCFSCMTLYHYWENKKPKNDKTRNAIALVQRAIALKDLIKPKYWVVENPNGMMKYVLGTPNYYTWWGSWYSEKDLLMKRFKEKGITLPPMKPTSLWGLLPNITWRPKPKKGEYQQITKGSKLGIQSDYLRPEERACIPYEFSEALAIAIENNHGGQTALV